MLTIFKKATRRSLAYALAGAGAGTIVYSNSTNNSKTYALWSTNTKNHPKDDDNNSPKNENHTVRSIKGIRPRRNKIYVIGAGVAGICSAYELSKRDNDLCYDVVIIDAASSSGAECSAVAAGGMQMSHPVINASSWKGILSNLFASKKNNDFRYFHIDWSQTLFDPHFLRWFLSFAYHSLIQPQPATLREEMLKFTAWSVQQFDQLPTTIKNESKIAARGALALNKKRYDGNSDNNNYCMERDVQVLTSRDEILTLEPFVGKWLPETQHALYYPNASNGSSELFTKSLARMLETKTKNSSAVTFLYQTRVKQIHHEGKRVTRIELFAENKNNQPMTIELEDGDEIVIAAGSWTPKLMWQLNEYVPVYPLKGYCLEIPFSEKQSNNTNNIKTGFLNDGVMYFSKLGDVMRIASVGEFAGWDTKPTEHVNRLFRNYIEELPGIQLSSSIPTRCGLRPMSSDGAVIAGRINGWENLSINMGPGSTGWKVCLGAAKVLANDIIVKNGDNEFDGSSNSTTTQQQEVFPFDPSVLSPNGRVVSTSVFWSKLCLWRHA